MEHDDRQEEIDLSTVSVPMLDSQSKTYPSKEDADLHIETRHLNYTGKPISVGFRNGLVVNFPTKSSNYHSQFIVRHEYHVSSRIKDKIRNFLVSHNGPADQDFSNFKVLFLDCYQKQNHPTLLMKTDYEVPLSLLNDYGGTIYLKELDIILSTKQDDVPLHPFCQESLERQRSPNTREKSTGLIMHIVDNRERIGDRYVRMNDKVIRIKAMKNSLKEDGFYAEYIGCVQSGKDQPVGTIMFVKESEIDDVKWLFRSYSEAAASNERESEIALELKNSDVEAKRLDIESKKIGSSSAAQKAMFEAEKLQIERQKLQLEQASMILQNKLAEQERLTKSFEEDLRREFSRREYELKMEALRMKDFYEERSHSRKDTSEWVKIIPSVLMTAGSFLLTKGLLKF